jgi:hypothetical protein
LPGRQSLVGYCAKQCNRDQAMNDQESCRQNPTPVNARFRLT